MKKQTFVVRKQIEHQILLILGQKVLLDTDLAELYGVTAKRLNEQVKRNFGRFPEDFMFRLTSEENHGLRSQIATSKSGRGGRRYLSFVFTEHGAIMAPSVLNSSRAIDVSVFVVRAFVRLREMLANNRELADKVSELESKLDRHDHAIERIITAIKQLMNSPAKPRRQIGFRSYGSRTAPKALKARAGA